jgi:hypothetical protein
VADPKGDYSTYRKNDRYARNYLRPVAKSIYSQKRMTSMNGSLNSTMRSPGFATYEALNAKDLMNSSQQIQMAQTFNLALLDKNVTGRNYATTTRGETAEVSFEGPIRSVMGESSAAFTVNLESKIPELSETRREDREERQLSLLRRP